ncbi:MAG: flagellar motor switch phosphatase FliY [Pseudobutyrivibrio sp.]|jgi:flagellar motor switch protein FliN/FliY|uniref:Flagellar motor switch phosphatase FliY n=2 Tax=Pseudobutyrivibrio TaxID=46205 RepID=A0A2G3DUZ6_9FIRM|nr:MULTISPECIES: flagellar motor switch phosphatase FliY [Pseudobutyrivibrio]MBE5902784.1 flagellar motor switch phosphatase FliY [Pseudobutyrivibrio sp.]PHU34887.1 flagellar motor switch phosphatase FliY [Pseudobutyrivibrio ruminis]SCX85821.1 flagellar motor switch protein FliN/FliY [Pseudobutyrivibrio sp. AR14]
MGDGVLSQDEINALLSGGVPDAPAGEPSSGGGGELSDQEMDTIGEVANISMGSAATTLFSLVNKKVEISTPVVSETDWAGLAAGYDKSCVVVRIGYTKGLDGSNILVLKEDDVKVITDLMMGGDGTNIDGEISELHLSAISEAMNQMMGASATSLSSMLNKMVDISPPNATLTDLATIDPGEIDEFLNQNFVRIAFKMEIGDLVNSEMMQLYPISLAKEMCAAVLNNMETDSNSTVDDGVAPTPAPAPAAAAPAPEPAPAPAAAGAAPPPMPQMDPNMMQGQPMMAPPYMYAPQPTVNVQPAQFTPFGPGFSAQFAQENIDLILDVPLEVTVELGRTNKTIQDILDFAPGTIIELNKIAGEPIDVLVNGKYVAKGEVVVIEESFGVRITEIIKE